MCAGGLTTGECFSAGVGAAEVARVGPGDTGGAGDGDGDGDGEPEADTFAVASMKLLGDTMSATNHPKLRSANTPSPATIHFCAVM